MSTTLPGTTATFTANDWLNTDTYDSNGNTLWSGTGASGTNYYDVENRLTNLNNGAVLLEYNGDGVRVKKVLPNDSSSSPVHYLVDDRNPTGYPQVLEEHWGNSGARGVSNVFAYGLTLIAQQDLSANEPVASYYFISDGHGSTRLLLDTNATVVGTFLYDGYGNLVTSNATASTKYLYCGEQFDSELGMYYLRARYYKPETGRFWTMDTFPGKIGDAASMHRYLYAAGNPISLVDSSGCEVEFDAAKGQLVHDLFYPFALSSLAVTKWKDTPIGVVFPGLANDPDSGLKPDIIAVSRKVWYELKPISHKGSKLTDGTIQKLVRYGTLLARSGIQPGTPSALVPTNFPLGIIYDPKDGQPLQVWLEAGDVPGLIYYYFRKVRDDDDDLQYVYPFIVVPTYNSAARAISSVGTRTAISAKQVAVVTTASLLLYFSVAMNNATNGVY